MNPNEEDPVGDQMDRLRAQIRELEEGLESAPNGACAAVLEAELTRLRGALWDVRQREFDRDATGQDEEAFYSRFSEGDSIKYNNAGEPLGFC